MKKTFPIVLATFITLTQPALAQTPAPAPTPAPKAAPAAAATAAPASTPAAASTAADPDYNARVDAAKVALKEASADKIIGQMLDGLAKNPQAHFSAADIASIKASIDTAPLNKEMLDSMVKTFTLPELKMLGDFYGSPTGQSITKKMPTYMADVMPAIQDQLKQAISAHMQKMQQQGAAAKALNPTQH